MVNVWTANYLIKVILNVFDLLNKHKLCKYFWIDYKFGYQIYDDAKATMEAF